MGCDDARRIEWRRSWDVVRLVSDGLSAPHATVIVGGVPRSIAAIGLEGDLLIVLRRVGRRGRGRLGGSRDRGRQRAARWDSPKRMALPRQEVETDRRCVALV